MAIVFCHKERGISVEEEKHLVTVGIVKKSKTILVLLASPILLATTHFVSYMKQARSFIRYQYYG